MTYYKNNNSKADLELTYKNIPCDKMNQSEIAATSKLFSENYGVWSKYNPDEKRRGKKIIFSESMIVRNFANKNDRYVAMAFYDGTLVAHIFYMKRSGPTTKDII